MEESCPEKAAFLLKTSLISDDHLKVAVLRFTSTLVLEQANPWGRSIRVDLNMERQQDFTEGGHGLPRAGHCPRARTVLTLDLPGLLSSRAQ